MGTRPRRTKIEEDAKRFEELKADLARIEYFSKGTLQARMIKCGKAKCPCGADPKRRHGPYFEWTYKEQGKTVSVRLTAKAAPLFRRRPHSIGDSSQHLHAWRNSPDKRSPDWPKKPTPTPLTDLAARDIFITPHFTPVRSTSKSPKPLVCQGLAVVPK